MLTIDWSRYGYVGSLPYPRTWLTIQANLGLAHNTVDAYGRALNSYLTFTVREGFDANLATREHISTYVHELATQSNHRHNSVTVLDSGARLANATLQQRLTALRLYFDFLVEENVREDNPVGRGRYTPGKAFGGHRHRGLIPRFQKLPWIPNDMEWQAILEAARAEPIRNRFMLAMGYDCALRREELCSLEVSDIDPARRLLKIRAETTKNRKGRVVPYATATGQLYAAYLRHRRTINVSRGGLFLSESRRNYGQPVSIWSWSKTVHAIAQRAGVPLFTTHTLRHLCLTDLARLGWDLHEIAQFAGHRSLETTIQYIHLSGRDLAAKLEKGMAQIHEWRTRRLLEVLG